MPMEPAGSRRSISVASKCRRRNSRVETRIATDSLDDEGLGETSIAETGLGTALGRTDFIQHHTAILN